tara:strand:- start:668 stop:829 length:162 start_codon:yes stop_codon:yes gene_type:complete
MSKELSIKDKEKALHIGSVVVSDCNVCNGNGYYMKIGDYDGKIKGRMKCSCNN